MQYSICDGWINNLYDGNDEPYVFASLEEAIAELQVEFDDWQSEINAGERDEDERYDISSYEIVCNTTGLVCALDLVDRKVIVAHAYTYSIEVGPR